MQQREDIHSLSEIDKFGQDKCMMQSIFNYMMDKVNLQGISRILNKGKSKGFQPFELFKLLFVIPFADLKNINQMMYRRSSNSIFCGKDTFYRFMSSSKIDWRKVHHSFFRQIVKIVRQYRHKIDSTADPKTPACFILDDTTFPKTGKRIEGIGLVHDHTDSKHKLGIKALFGAWWDGKMLMPFDFSLHHEPGKKGSRGLKKKELDKQFSKARSVLCPGYIRLKELSLSKIKLGMAMLDRFMKQKVECRYVLGDSWFTCREMLEHIKSLATRFKTKLDYIGMIKPNWKITRSGESKPIKISLLQKSLERDEKIVRCKKYNCFYQRVKGNFQGIEACFYFVRLSKSSQWKCIICTDTSLKFVDVLEIYSIRWTIEVFFKDAKQNLELGKSQSVDLDAQIASCTLSCLNYIALAVQKRINNYETIGHMFRGLKCQFIQQNLVQRIWNILHKLLASIFNQIGIDINTFMKNIISNNGFIDILFSEIAEVMGAIKGKSIENYKCET